MLTEDCQIKNELTTSWTQGAIEKSQKLIRSATKIFFQPFALLETVHNEVVSSYQGIMLNYMYFL